MNPWGLFVLALGLALVTTGVKGNQRTVLSVITGHTPAQLTTAGTAGTASTVSNASALSVGTGGTPTAPAVQAPSSPSGNGYGKGQT